MSTLSSQIEYLKTSQRAFFLAVMYSGDIKNDYIKTLQTFLSVPDIEPDVRLLIEEEIRFFEES